MSKKYYTIYRDLWE